MKTLLFTIFFLLQVGIIVCQTQSIDKHIINAENYTNKGDLPKAINEYSVFLEKNPKNFSALKKRGILYMKSNQYMEAEADLSKCISIKPTDAEVFYNRGLARQRLAGNPGEMSFTTDLLFGNELSLDTSKIKLWEKILKDYQKATQINPKFIDAYLQSAFIKKSYYSVDDYERKILNHFPDAIEDYNSIIKIQPNNIDFLILRGELKFNREDYHGAEIDFYSAYRIRPNDTIVLYYLINVNIGLQKYVEARKLADSYFKISPGSGQAYFLRGNSRLYLNDFEDSVKDLDTAIIKSPNESDYYLLRGSIKVSKINLKNEGCNDLLTAKKLGNSKAFNLIKTYCN
jgi:tetratricopeptide (TPR) repeat protein